MIIDISVEGKDLISGMIQTDTEDFMEKIKDVNYFSESELIKMIDVCSYVVEEYLKVRDIEHLEKYNKIFKGEKDE